MKNDNSKPIDPKGKTPNLSQKHSKIKCFKFLASDILFLNA